MSNIHAMTEWGLPDRAIMTADDIAELGQVKEVGGEVYEVEVKP